MKAISNDGVVEDTESFTVSLISEDPAVQLTQSSIISQFSRLCSCMVMFCKVFLRTRSVVVGTFSVGWCVPAAVLRL